MASESFLLRVQSSEGTKRLSVSSHDTGRTLYEKIHDAFGLGSFDFRLYMDRARTRELVSTGRKTLTSFGLKHGDMLFMSCGTECTISDPPRGPVVAPAGDEKSQPVSDKPDSKSSATKLVDVQEAPVSIVEDEVDVQLSKTDGKIQRPRDPSHCRHNVKSQCVHCFPLDPWDEGYIKSNGIKHMSFNAYLRKLQSGMDKGKFVALENMDCSIKPDCPNHPPWPKALCSQCTPPAITLTRQKYRHVDHIMVENASIVDRFLDYWRTAGNQRLGFLYGYYEPHDAVPLGIRAVVTAIYEPPQDSTHEHINFQPDPKVGVVDYIASGLGLRRIGWIFTDLMPEDRQTGTVQSLRNLESHLLSAQEAITSAYFQNLHPNPCRFAREGFFGSKFVTVCVSGNEEKQIHLNGYQISDQGMGLVKYKCLVPTRDIPQLAYVLESSMQKYVPDVFYRMKDKYGNHITRIARPLPIEYLLLDVPLSTPVDPQYTLTAAKVVAAPPSRGATRTAFPVENRLLDRDIQDLSALGRYLRQFQTPEEKMDALNDLHVLVFLATCDTLPLSPPQEKLLGLLSGLRARDATAVQAWMSGDDWQTVEQLLEAVAGSPSPTPPPVSQQPQRQPSNSSAAATVSRPTPEVAPEPPIPPPERMDDSPPPAETWTCTHCTFINHSVLDSCEVCGLPKDQ